MVVYGRVAGSCPGWGVLSLVLLTPLGNHRWTRLLYRLASFMGVGSNVLLWLAGVPIAVTKGSVPTVLRVCSAYVFSLPQRRAGEEYPEVNTESRR